jgi:hypothetical protein
MALQYFDGCLTGSEWMLCVQRGLLMAVKTLSARDDVLIKIEGILLVR